MSNNNLHIKKILICGPSWVGDMVMSHSLIQVLAKRYPKAQLDMLAISWSRPIARFMPEIKTVISLPFVHKELSLIRRRHFGQQLIGIGYDQAYILTNSFKSALIPWFSEIPERIGWNTELRSFLLTDARKLDKRELALMHQRYAALGFDKDIKLPENIPVPRLQRDAIETQSLANKFGLNHGGSIIGVAPGAEFGASKQWPVEHYIQLVIELVRKGHHIILIGSNNDFAVCQQIEMAIRDNNAAAQITNFAGTTTLHSLISLLPLCNALVCHDSGVMHIAASLSVPLVALYGSTTPDHTPPLSNSATVLYNNLDCSPCFKRECPLQHHNCMRQMLPEQVLLQLEALL